jgi:hypothetical protein
MSDKIIINSWVGIHEGCDLTYSVNGSDGVFFMAGDTAQPFEFFFDFAALQTFVGLGGKALTEMSARAEAEEAEWAEQGQTAGRPV